jgi:hypothetical protein
VRERSRDGRSSRASLAGEPPCNSIVEVERASSDLVASAVDDALTTGPSSVAGRQDFAMCRVKAPLIAAFEGSMGGDEHAVFEEADL